MRARTRSHTQLSQWAKCGEQYRLTRICRVPSRPGWWFPGGTAVHKTIEIYLRSILSEQHDSADTQGGTQYRPST